ncbi:hypothetical protein V5P93_002161 [Actinokineospora auranticolor]|uniref:Uncharacterized protein n=1 Tax=Actinokineospora auranticolor TaxID=155976 RepID=A0A2S6GB90_9PSEU|nr:hypothetical protein [Actinokineospora auranticolor]PPK61000.1 hypothetical protein CLV40_14514 [Actinokineospora auranticolor]
MAGMSAAWIRVLQWWGGLCLLSVIGWVMQGVVGDSWPFPYWVIPTAVWVVLLVIALATGRRAVERE